MCCRGPPGRAALPSAACSDRRTASDAALSSRRLPLARRTTAPRRARSRPGARSKATKSLRAAVSGPPRGRKSPDSAAVRLIRPMRTGLGSARDAARTPSWSRGSTRPRRATFAPPTALRTQLEPEERRRLRRRRHVRLHRVQRQPPTRQERPRDHATSRAGPGRRRTARPHRRTKHESRTGNGLHGCSSWLPE